MSKLTRKERSDIAAQKLARELRFQMSAHYHHDGNALMDLLLTWMSHTGKEKFIRPEHGRYCKCRTCKVPLST